jgi:peptidoglycan hydrolase-like protein with peptidoglycan-binding domain
VSIARIGALLLGLTVVLAAGAGTASAQDPTEIAFWSMVKESQNAADVKAYLEAYPKGVFAEAARRRLSELEKMPRPAPGPQPAPGRAQPSPSPPDNRSALGDAAIVREVQDKLYNLNYIINSFDGRLNQETRDAIRAWQANKKQPQTGDLTMTELAALRQARLPTTWGALAFGDRGATAVVWKRPSRRDAVDAARSDCRSRNKGADCKILTAAEEACGALGYYASDAQWGAYGTIRPTLGQATSAALDECRRQAKRPQACGIRITFCADGSHQR